MIDLFDGLQAIFESNREDFQRRLAKLETAGRRAARRQPMQTGDEHLAQVSARFAASLTVRGANPSPKQVIAQSALGPLVDVSDLALRLSNDQELSAVFETGLAGTDPSTLTAARQHARRNREST